MFFFVILFDRAPSGIHLDIFFLFIFSADVPVVALADLDFEVFVDG